MRSRRRNATISDYRGIFAFRAQHESEMRTLFEARQSVEFDGVVDGEQHRLMVTLLTLDAVSGIVFFEGSVDSAESYPQASPPAS